MKIAVTGATSDFGACILPALLEDPDVTEVIGLGRKAPRLTHPKLRSVAMDIRSPDLVGVFQGCDVVIHLAFVVEEQRDKSAIHEVNLGGSRNTVECAHRAGVGSMIIASSVSVYGSEDIPVPVTEDEFPTSDPLRYYFFDKAEVEHYVEWWLRRHPNDMTIAMLRPVFVVGRDFSNDGIDTLTQSVVAFPDPDRSNYQFIHQDDLADAFHRAVKTTPTGPFNLGPRDWLGVRELAAMQGQLVMKVPASVLRTGVNAAYAMRILPFSSHWISSGEAPVDSTLFANTTGWQPSMTSAEAAAVMLLLRGRPVMTRRHALAGRIACDAALSAADRRVRAWAEIDHEIAGTLDQFEAGRQQCEHHQVPTPTGSVHVQMHRAGDPQAPAVVIAVPDVHSRYATAVGHTLAERGVTTVLMDRPGAGLSTGRRGRSKSRITGEAVRATVEWIRQQTGADVEVVELSGGGPDTLTPTPGVDGLLLAHSGVRVPRRLRPEPDVPVAEARPYTTFIAPSGAGVMSGAAQRLLCDAVLKQVAGRSRNLTRQPD